MNEPLISVIVPVYNVEKYLDECVESIVNQTYRNLEIILVDDGSPDNCPQTCDDWAKKDERIRVIHKENGGAASARNAGLDICTGDYISFIDSDDWIPSNFEEEMLAKAEKLSLDVVIANIRRMKENGIEEIGYLDIPNKIPNRCMSGEELIGLLLDDEWGIGVLAPNKLYHKNLFIGLRFIEGKIYEDVLLSHRLLNRVKRGSVLPSISYNYRLRDKSIMTADYSPKRLDAFFAYEDRISFYEQEGLERFVPKNILREYYCLRGCRKNFNRSKRKATVYYDYKRQFRKRVRNYKRFFTIVERIKFIICI